MIINQLMAMLLPEVVTLKIYEKIEGEENRIQKIIKKYLKAVLIVNILMYAVMIFLIKMPDFIFNNQVTLIYMSLSIVIAVVYPYIEKYLRANIEMKFEVKDRNEKKN